MNSFEFKISTPDGSLFEGDAIKVDVRGLEGELAIMAGHVPFMTAVKAGECRLLLPDGSVRTGTLGGGLLSCTASGTTLFAAGFGWKE